MKYRLKLKDEYEEFDESPLTIREQLMYTFDLNNKQIDLLDDVAYIFGNDIDSVDDTYDIDPREFKSTLEEWYTNVVNKITDWENADAEDYDELKMLKGILIKVDAKV